jgi:D-alanyl-D-alanine endopeptidase (penicillin-binding protein 7)
MSAHLFLSRKLPARLAAMLFSLAAVCGAPAHATEATATPLGHLALAHGGRPLALGSNAALIIDQDSGEMLLAKNADEVAPIASLTKLMTAMVVVDSKLPMDEELQITDEDTDKVKHTHSRLTVGTRLTRGKMLLLALMSSENRAAMSLSRNYPGGRKAFVAQMNIKAKALGMNSTHYADPAGLSDDSVSTARDLHRLLTAAYAQPLIRADSTHTEEVVRVGRHDVTFMSTNRLVRKQSSDWDIQLQKTGFTNEAGRCLVMQVKVMGHRLSMIFLDSVGTLTRFADAQRVRQHLQLEANAVASALPIHTAGATTAASP